MLGLVTSPGTAVAYLCTTRVKVHFVFNGQYWHAGTINHCVVENFTVRLFSSFLTLHYIHLLTIIIFAARSVRWWGFYNIYQLCIYCKICIDLHFLWNLTFNPFEMSVWVSKQFPLNACLITKTRLSKYIENLTTKNGKFSDKNSDIFHISAQNIDCWYSLEPPRRGGSNVYLQSMSFSKIRKIMYAPVNPNFIIYKWGLRGSRLCRRVFVMCT